MANISGSGSDDSITIANGVTDKSDAINALGGDDFIAADKGNDTVFGGSGDDWILGEDGNDVLRGDAGSDLIGGGQGDDLIDGGADDDMLFGDEGQDTLIGGAGDDLLVGGDGNDLLKGGLGADVLTGGAGADIFRFDGTDIGGFGDTITDFEKAIDKIDLRGSIGQDGSKIHITYNESGATITMDGVTGSIFVAGVQNGDLVIGKNVLPSCFLRGTSIRTTDGEVPVEALAIGDLVLNRDGEARAVRWIGRRAYDSRFASRDNTVHPVLIRAGALGPNLPEADLRVSGDHAMVVDGLFVRAEDLMNGSTIVRDPTLSRIEYFHVELESHDVIFANGAQTESYVNHDTRRMFSNWQEYVDLYGDEGLAVRDAGGTYARLMRCVRDEAELARLRASLPTPSLAA